MIGIAVDENRSFETGCELLQENPGGFIEPTYVAVYKLNAAAVGASLVIQLGGDASQWTYSRYNNFASSDTVQSLQVINSLQAMEQLEISAPDFWLPTCLLESSY